MELQSKRSHSALGACQEGLPLKRRVLNLAPSPVSMSSRTNIPRSSFLLSKNSTSEEDNEAYDSDFSKKPAVHFKTAPTVDSTLIDAVSKYSESEKEAPEDVGRANAGAATDLMRVWIAVTCSKDVGRSLGTLLFRQAAASKPCQDQILSHKRGVSTTFAIY